MAEFTHDVLVAGHGLAGAVLVQHLRSQGLRFHVFDQARFGSASRAAAGIVNPVSLRRDVPTWRATTMLAHAEPCYTEMEQQAGVALWHPMALIKLFPTPAEHAQWERAMAREGMSAFISRKEQPEIPGNGIAAPHGYGTVDRCAWLDLPTLLRIQRAHLVGTGELDDRLLAHDEIVEIPGGIRIGDRTARWIIHCNGPFADVPGLVPVKGELLTVRIPDLDLHSMLHRGVFLLPLGDHLYRVGSTYKWDDVWQGPTDEARTYLLQKLQGMIPHAIEVMEHLAGVRPTTQDRRPLLGKTSSGQAVFNGLGSRGVLLAPWCAAHLIAHLFHGEPLDPEVDLHRFSLP